MDGNTLSTLTLIGLAGLVLMQNQACSDDVTTSEPAPETTAVILDVLTGVGPNVILPTLERFSTEMELLETRISELNDAGPTQENLAEAQTAAQQQWSSAMNVWQELEVMQVGPAGNSLKFVGGQDLRDEIYSWPTVNACRVDQRTATESWIDDNFYENNLVNAYGLDALEHLLFADTASTCPSQVAPISDGAWEALGEEGIQANRAAFALDLSQNIRTRAEQLSEKWSSEGDNYSVQLTLSTEDSLYEDEQQALNDVFNALFYLETVTKDRKLAMPLGLRDCSSELCIEELESLESGNSIYALRANLVGFKNLFSGGDGIGMDDLLTDLGHGDLSVQILNDLDNAIAFIDTIEVPLDELILEDYDTAMELYDVIANVTTALKTDLAIVLQLEVPSEAAGDND